MHAYRNNFVPLNDYLKDHEHRYTPGRKGGLCRHIQLIQGIFRFSKDTGKDAHHAAAADGG